MSGDASLPRRLTTSQVCEIAGYGVATLFRRIRLGKMPAKIDRGREALFDRDAVLKSLGMVKDDNEQPPVDPADEWKIDPIAFREARARRVRQPEKAGGRDVSRAVRSAEPSAAVRLVADNTLTSVGPAHRKPERCN